MSLRLIKNAIAAAIEQVKESLPDEEIFDWRKHLLPKVFPFLDWKDELRDKAVLTADLQAGLLGAIIVLPQGIAFAIIAGLPPIYGLYTAMITPIVAALMGSSRHLVSGPTTAISLVIASTIGRFTNAGSGQYIEMTLVLTFLTGAIQLGMGIGKLGRYIGFVSHTVVAGFTAGTAILIITSQMESVLGIEIPAHASFLGTWKDIIWHFGRLDPEVFAVSGATLLTALVVRRVSKKIPYMLVALAVGTATAFAVGGEAAGIRFVGQMPSQLPPFSLPALTAENIHMLLPNAFALAILGLVTSVATARSVALKSGQTLDGNQEFIGQGASNLIGSFFSCYAGSGSFSRTGLNFESGAKTPASAIFAAIFLMLIVLFVAPYAAYLPMPVMAGLIILVGWNLLDFNQMEEIQQASREDNIILGVTFFTAIFAELEFAIYLGVLLSLYFYLIRTATPNIAVMATDPSHPRHPFINTVRKNLPLCPQVKIIRIDGNLYFGAIQHVSAILREYRRGTEQWLVVLASGINHVDLDGAEWLVNEAKYWKEKKGGGMLIVRLKIVAQEVLSDGGYLDEIGQENLFMSKTDALSTLYTKLDRQICLKCPHRVFIECATDPGLPPVANPK